MRRALLLPLCTLLACAHSQQSASPAEPAASTHAAATAEPSPEATEALTRAWMAMNKGEPAKAHAELQRIWNAGNHTQEVARYAADAAAAAGDASAAFAWVERAVQQGLADPGSLLYAKALEPVRKLPGYEALVERARKNALDARLAGAVGSGLEKISPREAGVPEPALAKLLEEAEKSGSAGLVLLRHGKLVGEWYFGGETHRIESMSATKGVVALAIGLLIDDGKIPSADTPVSTFFPEWKEGLKGKVTLRHLLSHTSGLAANRTTLDIYQSKDFVRFALDSEVVDEPGSRHFYNNKATNLLAGVVERASGEKMDAYLKRRLFAPLGIQDIRWDKDPSGNPLGMSGLQLHPVDFAKVGQLLLQKGQWQGRRILSEAWIRECTAAPSQPHVPAGGLLWWLIYEKGGTLSMGADKLEEARRNGIPEETLARLRDLVDQPMTEDAFYKALIERLGEREEANTFMAKTARVSFKIRMNGAPTGFTAIGMGGQRLVVLPEHDLVAVRMADVDDRVPAEVMEFEAFTRRVLDLVRPAPASTAR